MEKIQQRCISPAKKVDPRKARNTPSTSTYPGMVTVESAISLLILTLVFAVFFSFFHLCFQYLQAIDTTREVARLASLHPPQRKQTQLIIDHITRMHGITYFRHNGMLIVQETVHVYGLPFSLVVRAEALYV